MATGFRSGLQTVNRGRGGEEWIIVIDSHESGFLFVAGGGAAFPQLHGVGGEGVIT